MAPIASDDGQFLGVVIAGSFLIRQTKPKWVELTDPKMRSRILYTNPVCLLTSSSRNEDAWRKNVMTISWLTPINNAGEFVFSMNAKRYSAEAVVGTKAA